MENSDDDVPTLSLESLNALQEFYREQLNRDLTSNTDHTIEEDWQLSQFWYSEETAEVLTKECLRIASNSGSIACVSCPTLYKKVHSEKPSTCNAKLFEFDRRFSIYEDDFVFYDYNDPLNLSEEHKNGYDVVVADPPFLSEECLRQFQSTINYLKKDKVILCTGSIMEELVGSLLNLKKCDFTPTHTRKLGNEFSCFANYDLDRFIK